MPIGQRVEPKPKIAVFSLGGTIASARDIGMSPDAGVMPRLTAEDLLASIPGAGEFAEIQANSFRQLPSSGLSVRDILDLWGAIRHSISDGADGVVVTQGTDTLEDTAFILDLFHTGQEPIVVTGAMRHPGVPGVDGPANLLAAIATASSNETRGLGVLTVFADEIHAARWVSKRHTSRVSAFTSPNTGPIGWIAEGLPRIALKPAFRATIPVPLIECPRVANVSLGMGDDGRLLAALPELGYKGLVVQAMGGGHVFAGAVKTLAELARQFPVVFASRAGAGEILGDTYAFEGSEKHLLAMGLISAGSLDANKARLLLMLALASPETTVSDVFAHQGRNQHVLTST